jgi:hypothetical protein
VHNKVIAGVMSKLLVREMYPDVTGEKSAYKVMRRFHLCYAVIAVIASEHQRFDMELVVSGFSPYGKMNLF